MTDLNLTRVDEIIAFYAANNDFMGSVLIAQEKEALFSKGYGFSNLEWNAENSPKTKFRLGSLTKQFTAVAILILEEKGKLHVDDFISQHIANTPASWKNIKIFHLLTHTHGIPNYTQFPEFAAITTFKKTALEQVQLFIDKPLDFEPGSQYVYNNSGYVLLGYLIEVLTGQTYEAFIREHIFIPLEMCDSGYDAHDTVIVRRASGYTKDTDGRVSNAGYLDMSLPYAAGSLYSTVEDLLRWTHGLFGGKIISEISLGKMTKPFKEDYGFGVEIQAIEGINTIMHIGGINGFNSTLLYVPESKTTIAVLSNINTPGYVWDVGFLSKNIALKLLALTHDKQVLLPSEKKPIKVSSQLMKQYEGLYEIKSHMDLRLTFGSEGLFVQFDDQAKLRLFAESDTLFYSETPDLKFQIMKDKKGHVSSINLMQSGYELIGNKKG